MGHELPMNLLAHAYLSFDDRDILAGNMISDFVKGKKQYDYPPMIRKGIVLHRSIDTFTDAHSCTHEVKKFFSKEYGLYAGPISDIVYDYFLANDRNTFLTEKSLEEFTLRSYMLLGQNESQFPVAFRSFFYYMRGQNWLYNYRLESGIMKSLNGLAQRAKYMDDPAAAFSIFLNNRDKIEAYYKEFFPLLKDHAFGFLQTLLNSD